MAYPLFLLGHDEVCHSYFQNLLGGLLMLLLISSTYTSLWNETICRTYNCKRIPNLLVVLVPRFGVGHFPYLYNCKHGSP